MIQPASKIVRDYESRKRNKDILQVRISEELKERVFDECRGVGATPSFLVRCLLEEWLKGLAAERTAA